MAVTVPLDNPSFVRSTRAQFLACILHLVSSTLWLVSLSSAYWSRGTFSFEPAVSGIHTVGVWKTCFTHMTYQPYEKSWTASEGECWATSRYLFVRMIEVSSVLSFVSCLWIAVICCLFAAAYTSKSWRPFVRQAALPGSKLLQMLTALGTIVTFSKVTDVSFNVRLWARHLALGTVAIHAFEVIFLLCVGLAYKTWRRSIRDLIGDVSVAIAGRGQSRLSRNTEEGIPAPHEMTGVEISEIRVNVTATELCPEEAVAVRSPRAACKLGTYPTALGSIFGIPKGENQRRQLPKTPEPPQVSLEEYLPDPPQSSYSPREAELEEERSAPKRTLPDPPSPPKIIPEEPMIISNEVAIEEDEKRPKEIRVVEKELGDMRPENFNP